MLLCECSTGRRLQIALELSCTTAIGKGDVGFQSPRLPFGSVEDATRVVMSDARPQIVRKAGIEAFCICFALQNVNVKEFRHNWLAES